MEHKTADEEKSLFIPNSSCNSSSLLYSERTLESNIPSNSVRNAGEDAQAHQTVSPSSGVSLREQRWAHLSPKYPKFQCREKESRD